MIFLDGPLYPEAWGDEASKNSSDADFLRAEICGKGTIELFFSRLVFFSHTNVTVQKTWPPKAVE